MLVSCQSMSEFSVKGQYKLRTFEMMGFTIIPCQVDFLWIVAKGTKNEMGTELSSPAITPKVEVANFWAQFLDNVYQFLVISKCNVSVMISFIWYDSNGDDLKTRFIIKFDFSSDFYFFMNVASSCKYFKTLVAKVCTLNLTQLLVFIVSCKINWQYYIFFPKILLEMFQLWILAINVVCMCFHSRPTYTAMGLEPTTT